MYIILIIIYVLHCKMSARVRQYLENNLETCIIIIMQKNLKVLNAVNCYLGAIALVVREGCIYMRLMFQHNVGNNIYRI